MGHYSVQAFCRDLIIDEAEEIVLDSGTNVFSVITDDIEGLTARLEEKGATIKSVDQLDELEAVAPVEDQMKAFGLDSEMPELPPIRIEHGRS